MNVIIFGSYRMLNPEKIIKRNPIEFHTMDPIIVDEEGNDKEITSSQFRCLTIIAQTNTVEQMLMRIV